MKELNISTFIQIMQTGLKEHDKQESAGVFLLDAINNQEYTTNHGCYTNLDSKKISRLVSRKDPVPDGIKIASQNEDVIREVIRYYENEVLNDLNPFVKDDVLEKLAVVIRQDNGISNRKRKYLLDLFDAEQDGRFLAEVFLYAVNRDNRLRQEDSVDSNDIPLLAETNYECPLSHVKLVETVKGEPVKRYVITQIYPEDLAEELDEQFNSAHKRPMNLNSPENLIALSEKCSGDYLLAPTIDEYNKLYELKQDLANKYRAKMAIDNAQLEEDIRSVVAALLAVEPETELTDLEYDALHIEEKVNDFILKNEIQFNAVRYYRYIESVFSESDADFELIASEIKIASMQLEKSGLSQAEVVATLSEWIRNKTALGENGLLACNIVVAFFIQNCEVFHK